MYIHTYRVGHVASGFYLLPFWLKHSCLNFFFPPAHNLIIIGEWMRGISVLYYLRLVDAWHFS